MTEKTRIPSLPVLGDLTSSEHYHDPIPLTNEDPVQLKSWIQTMFLIRFAEELIGEKVIDKTIKCPCHLAIGQEAVAVAVAEFLRGTDRCFGAHRSHSHYLALGAPLDELFFEVLGKEQGCSKGMGGSMHLYAEKFGLKGTVPIVAGTVPLAVGAAMAAKMDNRQGDLDLGVAFFGDGAMEEGVVHESMNLAMVYNLPMLFVVENNLFSSHMPIDERQPNNSVARFAESANMFHATVDGNNIVETAQAAKSLVEHCRSGKGPAFLEAVTYRWRGHVGPSEDIDVGLRRKDDLDQWKKRDPIKRLAEGMMKKQWLSQGEFEDLRGGVQNYVNEAWSKAEATGSFPSEDKLLNLVYKNGGEA